MPTPGLIRHIGSSIGNTVGDAWHGLDQWGNRNGINTIGDVLRVPSWLNPLGNGELPAEAAPAPAALARRANIPFPNSGAAGGVGDGATDRELRRIALEGELALAQYAQDLGVANADADFDRRGVQRDIGIAGNAGQIATTNSNQSYDDLINNLGMIIPQTEQAYATGVQGVGDAYTSGVQNLNTAPSNAADLQAQLAQYAPESAAGMTAGYTAPRDQMAGLLGASGVAASADLQSMGAQDVMGARNMIPGFNVERGERLSDIDLNTQANLSELRNQLAGIHPDFIPFNMGALQLQQDRDRENAVRSGRQDTSNMTKGEKTAQFLQQAGRPDLWTEYVNAYTEGMSGMIPNPDPLTREKQPYIASGIDPDQYVFDYFSHQYPGSDEDKDIMRQALMYASGVLG